MKVSSFPECLRRSPSNAEEDIKIEMQLRGYADRLLYDRVVILAGPFRGCIFHKSYVTKSMIDDVPFTLPDAIDKETLCMFYIDGPPHLRRGVKNRDDRINDLLTELGFERKRYRYSVPLSVSRRNQICDQMIRFMEEKSDGSQRS